MMADVNWEMIILIIVIALVVFAGMGIFIGTRISSDKRRIRELEDELEATKKELEGYRTKVNSHFKKTSELFSQMTNSYRAIYMHLAEGSQELCSTDAALLKPVNGEFLKVTHEEKKRTEGETINAEVPEKPEPVVERETVQPAPEKDNVIPEPEADKHETAGEGKTEPLTGEVSPDNQQQEEVTESQMQSSEAEEEEKKEEQGSPAAGQARD